MLGEVVPQSSVLPGRPDLPPRAHSAHVRVLGNGKHNWGRGFQCGEGTSTPQPSSWPQIRPCTAARPPNPSGSSRSPSLTPSPLSTPPTLSRYPTPRRTLTIPPPRLRHKSLTPLHITMLSKMQTALTTATSWGTVPRREGWRALCHRAVNTAYSRSTSLRTASCSRLKVFC